MTKINIYHLFFKKPVKISHKIVKNQLTNQILSRLKAGKFRDVVIMTNLYHMILLPKLLIFIR
jgi:hypothetical protein